VEGGKNNFILHYFANIDVFHSKKLRYHKKLFVRL